MDEKKNQHLNVLGELKGRLTDSAENLVPWFYENMPEYYFRTHSEEEQIKHLQAILSAEIESQKHMVVLSSPCGTRITQIVPGGDMKALVNSLESLQNDHLQIARIYSSHDDKLRLDTFLLGPQGTCDTTQGGFKNALESILKGGMVEPEQEEDFSRFLSSASGDYVDKFEAERTVRHYKACGCVAGTNQVQIVLEKDTTPGEDRITIAMAEPPGKGLLLNVIRIFAREGINIRRAYGDEFEITESSSVAIITIYTSGQEGLEEGGERYERLKRQLKLSKWIAPHDLEWFADQKGWEIGRVKLLQSAAEFAHQFLIRRNMYRYTSDKIVRTLRKHPETVEKLVQYFEARFDPSLGSEDERYDLVHEKNDAARAAVRDVRDEGEKNIFKVILMFFRSILRTNYYVPSRFGLGFRLHSSPFTAKDGNETPFGVFCFHGPSCFGFHVRYRDMARGGMRIVRTRSQEQFEVESNRLLDEVTKLALAQQFKNKDIPEGGSKAVMLLGPTGDPNLAVKCAVDALLDLIVTDNEGNLAPEVVDYLGREEIIYLGPDENITTDHINWIVARARKRGYKWPSAFMSSKPDAGINHKEYGVTSEGVVVFSEEMLKSLGIDPRKEPFTVKLTGGPAGDVASNVIKIMFREYGDNAKILSMGDGHGAAFDPNGLDHEELMRLIEASAKADAFDKSKLSCPEAFVVSTNTAEGARVRDELHNTVVADLFVPAGGRPDTINERNWQKFLQADGKPTARAMVEGANIFISPSARTSFEDHGVLCVTGSSANKTGVICSSYEILAGLSLDDQEFLEIKDEYIDQLLDILRMRARSEARLLLREYRLSGGERALTPISMSLSRAINSLGESVAETLDRDVVDLKGDPDLCDLLLSYCPKVLAERYPERVIERVPRAHQFALLASYIASRILYCEGLEWVESVIKVRDVREVIRAYLEQEKKVAALLRNVAECNVPGSEDIAAIIETSGRQTLTMRKLGLGLGG